MTNKTEKDQNVQMPENENIQDEEQLKEEPEAEEQEQNDTNKTSAEGSEEKEETCEEVKEDEDLNTKYLRLMADFQNYKKRTEKQKSEIHAYANEKIVIEVMDNFERALGADASEGDSFKQGIEMIFKQLSDVLTDAGVKEIEAESTVFDPNFHNAVMMEDTDKVESGMVSEVLQKGYTLNGKVIRPAMVKVAN